MKFYKWFQSLGLMNILSIAFCSLCTSISLANSPLSVTDITDDSEACKQLKNDNVSCEYTSGMQDELRGVFNAMSGDLSADFARRIQNNYFDNIIGAFKSQYGASTFFGGKNLLNGNNGFQQRFRRKLQGIQDKCGGQFSDKVSSLLDGLESTDGKKELGIEGIPDSISSPYRSLVQKRILIAMVEIKRIELLLADYPLSSEQKTKLKERRDRIRSTYPIVQQNERQTYLLRQTMAAFYDSSTSAFRDSIDHPKIDSILFPKQMGGGIGYEDVNVSPSEGSRGSVSNLYNSILTKDLPPEVDQVLTDTFTNSMSLNAESIGNFCEMSPCEVFQLSPERTVNALNQMPAASRQAIHKGLCDCELNARREYVGMGYQLGAAGLAIGGFIVCPFTFGAGCAVGSASSLALAGMGAVNTVGAIQDALQYNPVLSVAQNLPGLTESEKRQVASLARDANGRIILGAAEIALGVPGAIGEARMAARVFSDPSKYIPNGRAAVVNSDALVSATERTRKELDKIPGEFSPSDVETVMAGAHRHGWHGQRVSPGADGQLKFGHTFRIDKPPPARKRGGYHTPFMEHPEFAETLKRIREAGYDVVIDPTRGHYGAGAYYAPGNRVVGMGPNTKWGTFIHEIQHLEFDSVIGRRWNTVRDSVYREGRSIREVLSPDEVRRLGEARVTRMEELIRRGHTETGINETLSVDAELRALGWRRWVPGTTGYRTARYASRHRANSLSELSNLDETQRRALFQSRVDAALNTLGTPEGMVGATAITAATLWGSIGIQALVNERTGKIIFIDENGRSYSLEPDKVWDYCLNDGSTSREHHIRRQKSGHCVVEPR